MLAFADVDLARGFGVDLHPRLPGALGDRIGVLEQPGPVGAAAVVVHRVRIGDEGELAFPVEAGDLGRDRGTGRQADRGGRHLGVDCPPGRSASRHDRRPRPTRRRRWASKLGAVNPASGPPTARATASSTSPVARVVKTGSMTGCMSDRTPARGSRVVPALQRVMVGKQQVARGGGLVEERRGRHLERDLGQRLRRTSTTGAARRPGWPHG